jgi:hypothetical protein
MSDSIKVDMELVPFTVPNYVSVKTFPRLKQEGFQEAPKYAIADLSIETLEKLCDKFREDVMAKKMGK